MGNNTCSSIGSSTCSSTDRSAGSITGGSSGKSTGSSTGCSTQWFVAVGKPDDCVENSVGCSLMMLPLYRHNVLVEAPSPIAHIPKVTEYECFVDIKSASNDVFAVFPGKPL